MDCQHFAVSLLEDEPPRGGDSWDGHALVTTPRADANPQAELTAMCRVCGATQAVNRKAHTPAWAMNALAQRDILYRCLFGEDHAGTVPQV